MSQVELAERSHIDQRYISNIENNLISVNADWEARIRSALSWPANASEAFAILAGKTEQVA
jgi:transcriptional regulator with XRE-family HTH domain